jgi:putative transposase
LSKNLYNVALYTIKKHYEETGKHLGYNALEKQMRSQNQIDYVSLPPNTSQQILMLVDRSFRSFFDSVRSYQKNKNKFKGIPRPPKYKHKQKGRNLLVFTTNQAKLKGKLIKFPKRTGLESLTTKVDNLKQVRIIPQSSCYVIEVVYNKQENRHENLDPQKHLAIDLGINNLATVVSDQPDLVPILVNGKPLKSINQFYNKKLAELKSKLKSPQRTSNRINKLTLKRNNKINNYLHHCSKFIVEWALTHNIGTIVIGYNEGWKQKINIRKKNNQNFVQIPFLKLVNQIKYKAELEGIVVITHEESYTSKCSALDLEPIKKHETYVGKRIKRGLFKSSKNLINADVNGALNILRKATCDDSFLTGIGVVVTPVRLKLSQTF